MRVITGALACAFICVSVNRYGRRGMLLLSAIVAGLSSLLLLALTQCTWRPAGAPRACGDGPVCNLFVAVCA